MDNKERINARYLMYVAALIAAGIAFVFWQNAAYNARMRAIAYSGGDDPSRALLAIGVIVVVAGLVAVVVTWSRKLRLLDGAGESRSAAQ